MKTFHFLAQYFGAPDLRAAAIGWTRAPDHRGNLGFGGRQVDVRCGPKKIAFGTFGAESFPSSFTASVWPSKADRKEVPDAHVWAGIVSLQGKSATSRRLSDFVHIQ